MKDKKALIIFLLVLILIAETTFLTFRILISPPYKSPFDFTFQKKLAEEYLNQSLYAKAITAYEEYLKDPTLTRDKRANISYIIGNIYMEDLSDYSNAIAGFVRAKVFSPSNPNISEINKKIVMCLERLGRPVDAERELSKLTSLKKPEAAGETKKDAVIVAKIGDRNITMAELDKEMEKLPSYLKDAYKEKGKKADFLKQYIAGELLYGSAKRRGLDNDSDIVDSTYNIKKQLMVEKLLQEEDALKVEEPALTDLKLYYEAHKDRYAEEIKDENGNVTESREKTFDEAKDDVAQDYFTEKRQDKLNVFINGLMKAEYVVLYDDALKEE